MSILIDPKGLLRGKRLRKLTWLPRLYYPYLFGMANFYARLELDYDLLLNDLRTINQPDLDDAMLGGFFREYELQGLCHIYKSTTGAEWVQFDTKVSMRGDYPTKEDNASPAPPADEYQAWLKGLHGEDWQEYSLSRYQKTITDKRKEAGAAGGKASGEARRSKPNGAPALEGDVVVDAVVVVDGVVDVVRDVDTSLSIEQRPNEQGRIDKTSGTLPSSKGKTKDNNLLDQLASDFANDFDHLLQWNPHEKKHERPASWLPLWVKDFRTLLDTYTAEEVKDMVILSQVNYNQKSFVRPLKLVERAFNLIKEVGEKKPTKEWKAYAGIYSNRMSEESPASKTTSLEDADDE